MKDDVPPTIIRVPSSSSTTITKRKESSEAGLFGKTRYKFWALAAILLLAFWSMFTGSVTLKWSAGNLTRFTHSTDSPIHDDLDILEVEERKKVVRHMWDVYTHSKRIKLPRFWLEAFEAAYEHLVSDVSDIQDAAVSEIAKMSLWSINLDQLPLQSKRSTGSIKRPKQVGKRKEAITVESS